MGENLSKRNIVISAVNFFEGGPLRILKDNLRFVNESLSEKYNIIALVHSKDLFDEKKLNGITFVEFPKSRNSYFKRLYLEYFYFNKLSNKWNPYLWFSLHDMTPNVKADLRAVYCHNPTPFKIKSLKDLFFQPTIFFFSLFYKQLYKINIKKNNYVVVQQSWLKKAFINLFKLDNKQVLVCYPKNDENKDSFKIETERLPNSLDKNIFTFFYPALARPFKNFEVIGEAIKILEKKGVNNFQVFITINGNENNYAKYILKKYKNLKNLKFVGMLPFEEVNEYYKKTDVLLFPSTLETWGLPITEFKSFQKPIILSKLPYAFETLGEYDKGIFFDPLNANELSQKMEGLLNGNNEFSLTSKSDEEILYGWGELYNEILKK